MLQFEDTVKCWDVFELRLPIAPDDALYADAGLRAVFERGMRQLHADGFYDGNGSLIVRFMPDEEGEWSFHADGPSLPVDGMKGEFLCLPADPGVHGPVRVADATHFAYADGTAYTPFGTELSAWHIQNGASRAKTIRTLQASAFNKARMSLMPNVEYTGSGESNFSPFAFGEGGKLDFDRYNPAYFARLEECLQVLAQHGIEAELTLLPANEADVQLTPVQEERYIRYVVSRLAAYRNVWWTIADLGDGTLRRDKYWRCACRTVRECDYGQHLLTVHGAPAAYDWGAPWLTHISLRHEEVTIASTFTLQYEKPVMIDHCGYEGTGPGKENALTPEELVCRIWEGMARGGYVTHGESLVGSGGTCWSIHGGELQGESWPRIAYLRKLLSDAPDFLSYNRMRHDVSTIERQGEYALSYFGAHRCTSRLFAMPGGEFAADLIDTWNMKLERLDQTFQERFVIKLPGKLYYALRLQKVSGGLVTGTIAEEDTEPLLAVGDGD
ncbi:DUF5605 domain-containing protein [Paenibacillus sp. OAE614]|uniref:DUF5605 domain-containing protein n=1 Tax=Paenibacillus sp. OAE614 TaxID=2663804 RepID=UPI00178BA352